MTQFSNNILTDSFKENSKRHYPEINFIKSIAIVAVITLHTYPEIILFSIIAPLHIWHAVPIFMMLAGMNSSLSAYRSGGVILSNEYSVTNLAKKLKRLLVPFSIIWFIEIIFIILSEEVTIGMVVFSYFTGGIGPGSYFTPLFVQHILFFPIILWVIKKYGSNSKFYILMSLFGASLLLEALCSMASVGDGIYRIIYIRYLFAAVLGSYLVYYGFTKSEVLILSAISMIYILCISYLNASWLMGYPAWGFQHAPAYFYTVLLIACLWRLWPVFKRFEFVSTAIGKSSYHIFLVQMMWFWIVSPHILKIMDRDLSYLALNVFGCIIIGFLFYTLQSTATKLIELVFSNNQFRKV